jgi:hypothetical protein
MKAIQFVGYDPETFQAEITANVKSQLDAFLKHFTPKQPNEYLTRAEVAKMFNVDISTVSNWQKSKKLKPRGIGARVYFLRSEVEASVKPLSAEDQQ